MALNRKIVTTELTPRLLAAYQTDRPAFWKILDEEVLAQKIRFPLLESLGELLFESIPQAEHFTFCDQLIARETIGGNVLIGTILRLHLPDDMDFCFEKTKEYLIQGDVWYVCDIISERVPGRALLQDFDRAFALLQQDFIGHENGWIRRSPGVAGHLAVKWGLEAPYVERYLDWAVTLGNSKDDFIRTGIGWAVKTVARFHSDLVRRKKILDNPDIGNWMKRKIEIGLARPRDLKSKDAED